MKTILVLLTVVWATAAQAQTADVLSFLSPADRSTLDQQGVVTVFADRYSGLHLGKGSPFEAAVAAQFDQRDSTLAAEALFLVPVSLPPAGPDRDRDLQKALTSVSTMKNLQVYSTSLKRMETFIFDAYRTQTTDKGTRLPDPDPAASIEFTMFQNEEQTGESFTRYSFAQEPRWYRVTLTNLTSLNYGIFPLVSPGDLLTTVFVVPVDDKLLIYGVTVAKTVSLFGLERTRTASLYNRMAALVTWLTNNLKGTGRT